MSLSNDKINELLGISEAYEMPDKLSVIMQNKKDREKLFLSFLDYETDFSFDWFTNYFQEEHGDRAKLKQDYTPACIGEILTRMKRSGSTADICAGTGGLTIKAWHRDPEQIYCCEEIASRAVPILLFNLAIRNVMGYVIHGDTLTGETYHVYKLDKGERFSDITEVDERPDLKFQCVISNPPYSLKWKPPKSDPRFEGYGIAPAKAADYAFLLHSLNLLEDGGQLLEILPHGVLFRGNSEGKIRKQLTIEKKFKTIIGLPEKLFLNTTIPVCLIELTKSENPNCLFIDASGEYKKAGKQNLMEESHIIKTVSAAQNRQPIERFASIVEWSEIEENGYNFNIPRYVDTSIPEPVIPLAQTLQAICENEREIKKLEDSLISQMKTLVGLTDEDQRWLDEWLTILQPSA